MVIVILLGSWIARGEEEESSIPLPHTTHLPQSTHQGGQLKDVEVGVEINAHGVERQVRLLLFLWG